VQLFDRDLFKSNDFICELTLDLKLIVRDCRATQKPIHLSRKYYASYFRQASGVTLEFRDDDSFWLSVKRADGEKPIRLLVDLRLIPGINAKNQPVGTARSEPNHSPQLKEPWGRIQMSMNPLSMLAQLVSPELRDKCYAYMGTILCLTLLVVLLPLIASDLASKLILSLFGLGA